MTVLRLIPLIALLVLTGCGEEEDRVSVTLLNREMSYDRGYLTSYPKVAEVHNAPFDGVSRAEVAAMLRLPPSYEDDGGFILAAPGEGERAKVRLTLAFNSRAPLSATDMCAATRPLGAPTPLDDHAFMVDLALCRDDVVIASGSMTATAGGARDAAFADRSLHRLMMAAFGNHDERDQ